MPWGQIFVTLCRVYHVLLQTLTGGKQWAATERRFDLSVWSLYKSYMSIVIPGKGQRVNLIVCRYLYRQNRNPNIDQPDHTCLFPKKLVLISDFYLCSIKWLFLINMQNQYLIFEERSSIQNQIDRHDMLLIKLLAPKHHWPSLHMMKIQAIQFF